MSGLLLGTNSNKDKLKHCPHVAMVQWWGAFLKQIFTLIYIFIYFYSDKC